MTSMRSLPQGLAQHTTLGVGGPPARWTQPPTTQALIADVQKADAQGANLWILGGGSNMVFHDDGFEGWVVQPMNDALHIQESRSSVTLTADAGMCWDDLVRLSVENGWTGIEALSGIPGHVGAAPIQNIGAYGQEIADVLMSVQCYDRQEQNVVDFEREMCAFSYRQSRFKQEGNGRWVVLNVTLSLQRATGNIPLKYGELQKRLGGIEARDPATIRQAVLQIRMRKGMVYQDNDPDSHSVGSFFMNPIVSRALYERVQHISTDTYGAPMPHYPTNDKVKLSAAWLITHAGIPRGFWYNRARVSTKHVLALTNPGSASAHNLRALALYIQTQVLRVWGIRLVPEARVMTRTGLDHRLYHDNKGETP